MKLSRGIILRLRVDSLRHPALDYSPLILIRGPQPRDISQVHRTGF